MKKELILTVVASDQPGRVSEISRVIAENDGSWVDSAMARLGGQFAGVLRVGVPAASVAKLEEGLAGLAASGIAVTVQEHGEEKAPEGAIASLSIVGQDQPGMVSSVAGILERFHVNIEALDSRVEPGSMSGEMYFKASARIVLPPQMDIEVLTAALEGIAGDIMIEIEMETGSPMLS
ncbi:glycine cleavage repressor GcvR [Rhodobacteraceae bacterium RKSG542]|uniref:glycine cleavage system protein R n=1 Tax=Pseudovibrio flavus TaxID=2529854 RepID=UPI0012BCF72D|nr:ACT domain-containing protein [Pseudovibrio flavus]MTI17706.1 glycine cleavage repressor GcvR [Pseudovibrio flavus]